MKKKSSYLSIIVVSSVTGHYVNIESHLTRSLLKGGESLYFYKTEDVTFLVILEHLN